MSRIAKIPVLIPLGVDVKLYNDEIEIKGKLGQIKQKLRSDIVSVQIEDGKIYFKANNDSKFAKALSGTLRSLIYNMTKGVVDGYERKLQLVGVGYRAKAQGKILNLSLGYSHPIVFEVPSQLNVSTPSQTEIILTGIDKQQIGQVAAKIRSFRSPEPYKGKGVRYFGEKIIIKEVKKK